MKRGDSTFTTCVEVNGGSVGDVVGGITGYYGRGAQVAVQRGDSLSSTCTLVVLSDNRRSARC